MKNYQLICASLCMLITFVAGQITIGGLFDYNIEENRNAFQHAIAYANDHILDEDGDKLEADIKEIPSGDDFKTSQTLCQMLQTGVAAVFGPESATSSLHAGSVCDAKEVPYIETRFSHESSGQLVNLYPTEQTLAQIAVDLVHNFEWGSFTIIYETASLLPRMADLLKLYDNKGYTVTVRQIDLGLTSRNKKNFRAVLRRIKQADDTRIIIECSVDSLTEVLLQAQQVGLLTEHYHYIVMTLDAATINLEPFQYSGTNFTLIRMVNPSSPLMQQFEAYMKGLEGDDPESEERINSINQRGSQEAEEQEAAEGELEGFSPERVRLQTALVHDGVLLLAEAFKRIGMNEVQPRPLECFDGTSTWNRGYTVTGFVKGLTIQGLSGEIQFDNEGRRSNIAVEVLELGSHGIFQIGLWNTSEGFTITREAPKIDNSDDGSIKNKTFVVLTALSKPYGMLKDSSLQLTGNDRFEGFAIDLIQELSYLLGFKYIFRLQDDAAYGSYNNETKSWNGMIGEVLAGRADLAITDLTITSERVSAIDFTPSFMNLGIAILYKRPAKEPPSTFSFMSPFSTGVWQCLGAAYMAVSLCLFFLGRISPAEWDNPYPCIEEPTFLENQFSLTNSMWFAIGALLQQGSEIAPKAASTRIVASIWWFFTLIMVSSYTANLAAFLVIENLSSPIKSAEDLKDCGVEGFECPVTFGAKKEGSTINFFKEAEKGTYKNMFNYMQQHPEFLTKDNDEGLRRAINENYAYLMESSSIQYMIERNCEVTQIGDLLDDKNYGIGMRKEYKYYSELSEGVLRLQEQGKLAQLQTKWWKEKKGGGACSATGDDAAAVPLGMPNLVGIFYVLLFGTIISIIFAIYDLLISTRTGSKSNQKKESQEAEELGMQNMYGVFFVLLIGSIFSCLYGWIEWFLNIYKNAKHEKVPFKEELMAEIRFIAKCQGNTKPVRHRKSGSMDSRNSGASYRSNDSLSKDNGVD